MLGNDIPCMTQSIPEYTEPKKHREHIKYEIIKNVPPTKKWSSSVLR